MSSEHACFDITLTSCVKISANLIIPLDFTTDTDVRLPIIRLDAAFKYSKSDKKLNCQ